MVNMDHLKPVINDYILSLKISKMNIFGFIIINRNFLKIHFT